MNEGNNKLIVTKIQNGTVIDRIPPGKALKILEILGIDSNYPYTVALVMRVASRRMKLKDVVKIKGKAITPQDIQKLSFIAPTATVNIINDYEVKEKVFLKIPDHVEEFVDCVNPNCVSNTHEPIVSSFDVVSKDPLILRCVFCDRLLDQKYLNRRL
ncbi:MAG: aspartate carbamoyltransferase regulatory subunit [Candidatus Heimdallarchaeota archaeon]|nr:aspartate carbamoyltransferase regulatory subunit [Candidatus Heimdallarchaeota archaeon]